jgi:hypothetical protein
VVRVTHSARVCSGAPGNAAVITVVHTTAQAIAGKKRFRNMESTQM